MEFGLVCCCYDLFWDFTTVAIVFGFLGSPAAVLWIFRIFYRWNTPWFEGRGFTHIEFPLPQIVPPAPYEEPMPVAMMVGSCSEAKRCAYCHEEFDCDSARRFCFACKSATHEECAILNGSCSVFGCIGTTLLRSA
ncbi:hypothetical protein L0152_08435 [bacterium]|nr:hypothetical protein [bacterium]